MYCPSQWNLTPRQPRSRVAADAYLGDIAIAPAVARANAVRFGRTFDAENAHPDPSRHSASDGLRPRNRYRPDGAPRIALAAANWGSPTDMAPFPLHHRRSGTHRGARDFFVIWIACIASWAAWCLAGCAIIWKLLKRRSSRGCNIDRRRAPLAFSLLARLWLVLVAALTARGVLFFVPGTWEAAVEMVFFLGAEVVIAMQFFRRC